MTQDQKLDLLLEKYDVMSGQMGSIDNRLSVVEKRLESVDNRLTTLEGRVDALDHKVDALDNRVAALDHKVTAIDKKEDKHYRELKSMDKAIFDEVERVHHILMRHQADKKVHTA